MSVPSIEDPLGKGRSASFSRILNVVHSFIPRLIISLCLTPYLGKKEIHMAKRGWDTEALHLYDISQLGRLPEVEDFVLYFITRSFSDQRALKDISLFLALNNKYDGGEDLYMHFLHAISYRDWMELGGFRKKAGLYDHQ